jgi:hypothetical protein
MATDPGRTDAVGAGTARGTATGGYGRRGVDETKAAFKTTEFFAYLAVLVGVLIAGLVIKGGDDDEFKAVTVWLYIVILTFGYMLSRGIAKSGTKHRFTDDDGPGR